ncbi:MAG: oligosaccharide flippase family protein [Spirochaetales bacterium]|nr:oligosaccharide flippase family protein [Spirochaetales bacterium]
MKELKINKFLISSIWYLFAIVGGYSIAFIGNIIFTHIMTTNEYGMYTTYYSIVSLAGPFICGNLFVGLQNGYFDFKENRKNYRASVFFLSFIIFCITSLLSVFICFSLNKLFSFNKSLIFLFIALLHSYLFFIINYYNTYENLEGKFKTRSLLIFLQNVLPVFLSILLILLIGKNGYFERIIGSITPLFIISIFLILFILKGRNKLINKNYFSYALKISIPSVLGSISSLIMSNADNIMITSMVNAEATAVYGFMYNIGNVLVVLLSAVEASVSAWIYNALDTNRTSAAKSGQKWYFAFFILIISLLLMIFPEFIKFFTPSEYWDFRYISPFVFSCSLSVVNTLHCNIINFNKKTGQVSFCVLVSAILNVLLNYIFIKKFGSVAAAYTSLICTLLQTILLRIVLKKICANIFSDLYSLLYILFIMILCLVFSFTYNNVLIRYAVYSSIILILGILILMNKEKLRELIKR